MLSIILLVTVLIILWIFARPYLRKLRKPKPPYREVVLHPAPLDWNPTQVTVAWVGHSTVLINLYGYKIITDPVLTDRVGVSTGLGRIGPKRHTSPAISLKEIGSIDLVLLSHAHLDHFDLPTLKQLAHPETRVVTAHGTSRLLRNLPFKEVHELRDKEELNWGDEIRIVAVPVNHWGNRYPWNRGYGYTGYLIERKDTRIFFPGDTAYTPKLRWLQDIGEIDLAFMPIGGYYPFQWAHCAPEQAWEMYKDTGAKRLIPIHWDTFVLSHEPVEELLQRLIKIAGPESDQIVIREHGKAFQFEKNLIRFTLHMKSQ